MTVYARHWASQPASSGGGGMTSSSPRLAAADPIVCVLRHQGELIYRGDWGGSLRLVDDEWHVYLPEDHGDPTMHSVLDDAVKRLVDAAYRAGRDYDPYDPPDADERAENDGERIAEMSAEEREGYGDL